MLVKVALGIASLLFPVAGICAKWEVPSNVTVRDADKRASYLEAVDFSYQPIQTIAFAKLKLCVAENISNNAVSLRDSSNAYVGPATGTYYQNSQSQTVQGGSIFKYLDDSASALIATGTADGGSTAFGLSRDILKFDLKAAVSEAGITLKFSNIARAAQDSGAMANNGFQPVGMWRGAGAQRIFNSLEAIADKIKTCLQ